MKKNWQRNYKDEILIPPFFDVNEAKKFINQVKNYKKENKLNQIFMLIPKGWHSDYESRKILFEYLKQTQDKVIIESSPVLRAIIKTELIVIDGDPQSVLKKRPRNL